MTCSASIGPHRRIRALNGPLEGRSFPVHRSIEIGRSHRSDIQLVGDGVSRRHARIRRNAKGRDQIEDLGSTNGTVVDGLRIRRQLLAPQMVFCIGKTRFIYEDLAADEASSRAAREHRSTKHDPRTRRATIAYPLRQLRLVHSESTLDQRDPDAPIKRRAKPPMAATRSLAAPRLRLLDDPDKAPAYPGDLVYDVLDYRSLRAQMLAGDLLGHKRLIRLHTLEERLRGADERSSSNQRSFRRYRCHQPAELEIANGDAHPVVLVEMGADGARLHAPGHRLAWGMHVSVMLLVPRRRGGTTTVLFPARVAWVENSHAGLQFEQTTSAWRRSGLQTQALPAAIPEGIRALPPAPDAEPPPSNSTSPWPRALSL